MSDDMVKRIENTIERSFKTPQEIKSLVSEKGEKTTDPKLLQHRYDLQISLEEGYRLSYQDYKGKNILLAISTTDPKTVKKIASIACCNPITARRHIKRFVKLGLVVDDGVRYGKEPNHHYQLHSAIMHKIYCAKQDKKDGYRCLVKQKFDGVVMTCYPYKSQYCYEQCPEFVPNGEDAKDLSFDEVVKRRTKLRKLLGVCLF